MSYKNCVNELATVICLRRRRMVLYHNFNLVASHYRAIIIFSLFLLHYNEYKQYFVMYRNGFSYFWSLFFKRETFLSTFDRQIFNSFNWILLVKAKLFWNIDKKFFVAFLLFFQNFQQ